MNNSSPHAPLEADATCVKPPESHREILRKRCNEFHRRHPEVWSKFVEIALELIRQGCKRYGAQTIFAIIRYQTRLGDDGKTRFKINNDFAPFYARRFLREYPEHAGFFQLRKQTSAARPANDLPELTPDDFDDED